VFIVGFYLCILLRVTDKLEIIEDKVIDANERFAQMESKEGVVGVLDKSLVTSFLLGSGSSPVSALSHYRKRKLTSVFDDNAISEGKCRRIIKYSYQNVLL
jgi:hypothetical protein